MSAKLPDTVFDFTIVFMALAGVYGIIVSVILFVSPLKQAHNKRLLGISLFSYSWYCLVSSLMYSHLILSVPHLFRTATPLMYLVAPASYLYIRSTINEEKKFKRFDWVHFIPFILIAVEFLPFYVKGAAYKVQEINYYLTHGEHVVVLSETIVPEKVQFALRIILMWIYVFLQWKILIRFLPQASLKTRKKYHILIRWLGIYILLTTLIAINFSLIFLFNIFDIQIQVLRITVNLLLAIHLLAAVMMLVFNPKVLYSLEDSYLFIHQPVHDVSGKPDKITTMKTAIDDLLLNKKCFLTQGYSLSAMAGELNVSVPLLSSVINHEYKLSFTDLINKHRIEYIIKNLNEQQIINYTLEGIAFESGFKSRITFYRAFVKITGRPPSDYFKKIN